MKKPNKTDAPNPAMARSNFVMPAFRIICLTFFLTVLTGTVGAAGGGGGEPLTAIVGALPQEMQLLEARLQDGHLQKLRGVAFRTGTLNKRKVVLARSGIGKVNAAVAATLLIEHFKPAEVLFTGTAGGLNPELLPGDIVIGEKTVQHDFGEIRKEGFRLWSPGRLPDGKEIAFFPASPPLLAMAVTAARELTFQKIPTADGERVPKVRRGVIATGDVFVASFARKAELHQKLNADAVEMEGAAIAQVCWQQNVPCLVIRSLSDRADEAANEDFKRFVKVASDNSALLTLEILNHLSQATHSVVPSR